MSRRVTRSQQRKQDSEREREAEAGSGGGSINGDGSFSGSSVNGVESVEGTPRKGRSPTKRQKLTAVVVMVEKVEEEAEVNGSVSGSEELKLQEEGVGSKVQEGIIEEKKVEQKEQKEEEKTENKTPNGVVKGAHRKFSEEEEEPTREVVEAVAVEANGDDATNTNEAGSEDESDNDDDAPEAVSISTGRQAILAREEEIKKATEQYDPPPLLIHLYPRLTNPPPSIDKKPKPASNAKLTTPVSKTKKLPLSPNPLLQNAKNSPHCYHHHYHHPLTHHLPPPTPPP